jgi:hypothetical protein
MVDLAGMLRGGVGIKNDDAEAFRWYQKAAALGNAEAMYNLGLMFEYGRGVQKDEAESTRWYRKAADAGHKFAQDYIKSLDANGHVKKKLPVAVPRAKKCPSTVIAGRAYRTGSGSVFDTIHC